MQEEETLGRAYKDGDIILEEGSYSREMYVIQSGKVKIVKEVGEEEITLAVLSEGDIFGILGLIEAKPRIATVKAIGKTTILAVDHEMFLRQIKTDPMLAIRVFRQLAGRIRTLDDRLSNMLQKFDSVQKDLIELKDCLQYPSET